MSVITNDIFQKIEELYVFVMLKRIIEFVMKGELGSCGLAVDYEIIYISYFYGTLSSRSGINYMNGLYLLLTSCLSENMELITAMKM